MFNNPLTIQYGNEDGPLYDPQTHQVLIPYSFYAESLTYFEKNQYEKEYGKTAQTGAIDTLLHTLLHEAGHAYIEDQKRSIDILINNAGMNIRSTALEVTDQEWQTIMDTNLKSAFMMSQETGKHMKEKKQGKIINIASVAGHVALRTGVVYASTKAAMIQMTKVLAMEWGKYNINVNSIGPWYFKTPLTAE
mgnify:CR=1 FL=1